MSLARIVLILIFATLVTLAVYFGWRYFFDPAGIYLADGEICAGNESNQPLVISVEANPGAKLIQYVEPNERVCAPSPVPKPSGIIMAGEDEDRLTCAYEVPGPGKMPFVMAYLEGGKCDWGFVSR